MNTSEKVREMSALEEAIGLASQLPMSQKMDMAKSIIEKVTYVNFLNDKFEPDVLRQIEDETVILDREWRESCGLISPADLAMMYLFKLSEVARVADNKAAVVSITSTMSKLLGLFPRGNLHARTLELPLKAFSMTG